MALFGLIGGKKKQAPPPRKRSMLAYAAAATDRLFADWNASNSDADGVVRDSLAVLRNRCRDMERNNEYFARYLRLMQINVVGPDGIKLQSKAENQNGSPDNAGNRRVEAAWKQFCKCGVPTVDGKRSMVDLAAHVARAVPRDGEVILRKIVSNRYKMGMALQVIEPDLLDETLNRKTGGGNPIIMGVELDEETRAVVAYHFLRSHPGSQTYHTYSHANKHRRVPADQVIHIYHPDRADQTRGVPWASNTIRSLKMLHGYREAELVAARTSASKMGFFTSPAGDGFTADAYENDDGTGAPILNAEPGTFHQLPAGVDFTSFDPAHPTSAYADFEKAILRGVASGMSVDYSSLTGDLEGVSYSSLRQGALMERDNYKAVQSFLVDHLMVPIYEWWLQNALDFGILPFGTSPDKFFKFSVNARWQPRGFPWVDPVKEMQANVLALQNGLTSHSDVLAMVGKDADDLYAQIQRDKETAEKYGLSMNYSPFGDTTPTEPPDRPGVDDE
jgi:lambda family phage portal protein